MTVRQDTLDEVLLAQRYIALALDGVYALLDDQQTYPENGATKELRGVRNAIENARNVLSRVTE